MSNDITDNKKSAPEQETVAPSFCLPFPLSPEGVVQGVIFSEVLGKPKALRKGRWQRWN